MNRENRYRNRQTMKQATSSESTMNTQEESTMGKETNEFVTEANPTVEAAFDTDVTPDAKVIPETEIIPDTPVMLGTEVTLNAEITPVTEAMSDTETLTQSRSLDDIREEFCIHYRTGSESVYRMGELLNEAKAQLPEHLKWLDWLHSVNYPERQAQRVMRLAKGYPDPTTLSYLGQSKALALLKVDEDKRDEFIEESHMVSVRGVLLPTSVHEMSVRQLEDAIRAHKGKSKKKTHESISQAHPLMSHNDEFEAPKSAIEFDRKFEYLQLCIDSLCEYIEGLTDNPDKCGELTDKLCLLCTDALQRIQMREDRCL